MLSLALSLIECCACARENNDPRQMYKLSPAVDPRRSRAKQWRAGGYALVAQCGIRIRVGCPGSGRLGDPLCLRDLSQKRTKIMRPQRRRNKPIPPSLVLFPIAYFVIQPLLTSQISMAPPPLPRFISPFPLNHHHHQFQG